MGGDTSMPMDDASFIENPDMGQDVDAVNTPGMEDMGDQDMMGGQDMMNDPNMNTDMDMPQDDSTISIINQLSDEDKDAVRAYAESLISKNEPNDEAGNEENGPVMESIIFTKKQLEKLKNK